MANNKVQLSDGTTLMDLTQDTVMQLFFPIVGRF
mgnify:CR=1 FL=1